MMRRRMAIVRMPKIKMTMVFLSSSMTMLLVIHLPWVIKKGSGDKIMSMTILSSRNADHEEHSAFKT